MPIDPNIALSVQTPQMPNVGQSLIQGQQLALQRQTMLSLQQERDAQTQEIQAKAAAAQQLARNNATVDGLMKTAFTPDTDTGTMLFNRNVFQQGLVQAGLGHLYPQMSESLDAMEKAALATNMNKRKMIASTMWGINQAGNDPGALQMGLAFLKSNQALSPDHEQAIQQALAQNNSPDTVKSVIQHYAGFLPEYQDMATTYQEKQAGLGKTAADTAKAQADAAKAQADAAQQALITAGTKGGMTAADRARNAIELARLAEERRKTNLQFDPFGLAGGVGGGPLPGVAMGGQPVGPPAGGPPAAAPQGAPPQAGAQPVAQVPGRNMAAMAALPPAVQATVTQVLDGRLAVPGGRALTMPYWQGILNVANQVDPTFDSVNYNARAKTRQAFTSGKEAQQVNALNTVAGHLASLSQAADNLNNSWSPTYNSVANFLMNATGQPEVKQYNATQNAVVDELTRVWRQTGGTEQDIKSWADQLGASNSPAQIHGVVSQIGDLLESKLQALQDQNKQGMGTAAIQVVTPQTRAVLDALKARGTGTGQGIGQWVRDPSTGKLVKQGS